MNNDLMFSSQNMEWETPRPLVAAVEKLLGKDFTLDACASTAKVSRAPTFYSPEEDALQQDWPGTVWMNPPYGRAIKQWVIKAHAEAQARDALVACLLPARTDTRFFHDTCVLGDVFLLRGRITFELGGKPVTDDKGRRTAAPFPSMIVVFTRGLRKPYIKPWTIPQ